MVVLDTRQSTKNDDVIWLVINDHHPIFLVLSTLNSHSKNSQVSQSNHPYNHLKNPPRTATMGRGETEQIKVHYQGEDDDFIVMAETASAVQKWRADKTVPLIDVVSSFDIFVTNRHGNQGTLSRPSKAMMENEFGTSNDDDVIKKILEDGTVLEQKVSSPQDGGACEAD
jgi:hypothetical protein